MNINIVFLFIVISISSLITQASSQSVKIPALFANGPLAVSAIRLKTNEIASLMLLESVMDISSSAVLANGCQAVEDTYSIQLYSDGSTKKPESNVVKITSRRNSEPLVLHAILEVPDSFIGQNINIHQAQDSKLRDTPISEYTGIASINKEFTLLLFNSNIKIPGQNNKVNLYSNTVIKHFYEHKNPYSNNQYIFGWGSMSLSQSGFPQNKYWIGFKALRINEQLKRVVIKEDRLIGNSICHIHLDSSADMKNDHEDNNNKNLIFKGFMTINKSIALDNQPITFDF